MEHIIRTTRFLVTRSIKLYQYVLSPYLGSCCRFYPSCSNYALESFDKHGLLNASWLTIHRLMRCHPWSSGGYDPVLLEKKLNFNDKNKEIT